MGVYRDESAVFHPFRCHLLPRTSPLHHHHSERKDQDQASQGQLAHLGQHGHCRVRRHGGQALHERPDPGRHLWRLGRLFPDPQVRRAWVDANRQDLPGWHGSRYAALGDQWQPGGWYRHELGLRFTRVGAYVRIGLA